MTITLGAAGAAARGCIVMEVLEVSKLPIYRLSILAIVLSAAGAGGQGVPPAAGAEGGAPVVLELFTSQGCSTCPPADRLLSELGRGGSAGAVIPLAFHVDYWDRLGWTDPFDSPRWSQRQQSYAHALSGDRLATPQLVIDGRGECVGSKRDEVLRKIAEARAQPPAAAVDVVIGDPGRGGARSRLRVKVAVRVLQQTSSRDLDLWVALTQSGLVTEVKGGENATATLRDDFVVRRLEKAFTVRGRAGEQRTKELDLALNPSWPLADLAVAAFVQDPSSLVIVGAARSPVAAQPRTEP
ncbi:MAG TPA: DUF1223 domain-containing protein [Mycobacterium sp.]|nr:DUF1223 domain-containing protein [Mycobacterium sp.]